MSDNINKHTKALQDQDGQNVIKRLYGLIEACVDVSASLTRKRVIQSIIIRARDILQAEVASVQLVDHEKRQLNFEFSTDLFQEQKEKISIPIGHGIAGYVAESGESLNIKDVNNDPRHYGNVDKKTGFDTRSMICVPLKIEDKIIGTAQVLNKLGEPNFSSFDLDLMEGFAAQAAIAIHNANVFEELQQARDLLGKENLFLKQEVYHSYQFENIIGTSEKMEVLYKLVVKVMDTPTTILLQGETGTGKEVFARAIHYNSQRKDKKFIAIDCGALPEQLLESELFGHKKGAFTGATVDKKGLFEEADGGTIFLDEIGDVSPKLQLELLRVLQQSEIRRIGENMPRKISVRVISATHKNLKKEIEEGRFREDLFYRLKVVPIELPPLRERREDVSLLVDFFIKKYSKKIGKKVAGITVEAMNYLQRYDWPGNVRELEHEIERLITISDEGGKLTHEFLSEEITVNRKPSTSLFFRDGQSLKDIVSEFEKRVIEEQLKKHDSNVTHLAKELGLTRQGLFLKMKKYNISR